MNFNMSIRVFFISIILAISSCVTPEPTAQTIIDQAIETAGGKRYQEAIIDFDFRDFHYKISRQDGKYQMERIKQDLKGRIRDVLNNDGFFRELNGTVVDVPDSMAAKYSNSINSVFYFALLPYGLNDAAVNKAYLGSTNLNDQTYHKIRVFFDEEGGGTDHDDVFIYWINAETNAVDFLAYEYHVHGGGMRFRQAYNPRIVDGIRFVDYINYKPEEEGSVPLEALDAAFAKGELTELSRIELKNVRVSSPSLRLGA